MYLKLKSKSNITLNKYQNKKILLTEQQKYKINLNINTKKQYQKQQTIIPQTLQLKNKIKSLSQIKMKESRTPSRQKQKQKHSPLQNYRLKKLLNSSSNSVNEKLKEQDNLSGSKLIKYQTSKNINSLNKLNFFQSKIKQLQTEHDDNPCIDFIKSKQLSTRNIKTKPQINNSKQKYYTKAINQQNYMKNIQINEPLYGQALKSTKIKDSTTTYLYSNFKSKRNQTLQQRNKKRNQIMNKLQSKQPVFCKSDFVNLKKLGQGQNGNIYSAIYKPLGMIFAIKHFKPQKMVLDYLIDQLKIQLFCKNQHILPAYGYIIQREKPSIYSTKGDLNVYLIMEKGQTSLFSIIKKQKKLKQEKVANYTLQILQGLEYLHDHRIIHRDIKPENIILINDIIKITDFGWSTLHSQERQTFCGTLEYLSPQVAFGQIYSNKIDCWSVGILMYEMITGQAPFIANKIVSNPNYEFRKNLIKNIPKNITQECRHLMKCLLKVNPKQRISVQQALKHPWFKNNRRTVSVQETILQKQIRQKLKLPNVDQKQIFDLTATNINCYKQFVQ